ncbi:unnamed protein product, partial [Ectocarpus sp. 6 AP-2014]
MPPSHRRRRSSRSYPRTSRTISRQPRVVQGSPDGQALLGHSPSNGDSVRGRAGVSRRSCRCRRSPERHRHRFLHGSQVGRVPHRHPTGFHRRPPPQGPGDRLPSTLTVPGRWLAAGDLHGGQVVGEVAERRLRDDRFGSGGGAAQPVSPAGAAASRDLRGPRAAAAAVCPRAWPAQQMTPPAGRDHVGRGLHGGRHQLVARVVDIFCARSRLLLVLPRQLFLRMSPSPDLGHPLSHGLVGERMAR